MSGYILFYTSAAAFECEDLFKKLNIDFRLVPTPREFSSDCGIAIYFKNCHLDLEKILDENRIECWLKII